MAVGQWYLSVVGINYRSSTLEQREPLQISREEIARANAILNALPTVKESLVLSTCNRVELYFVADSDREPFSVAQLFFREFKDQDITDLRDSFYIRKNRHAARHLFRVTAGIDSMVIGENQIVGQVKEAYSSACTLKSAGKVLHRLLHQAFRVGKEVRTDTEMGKGACSVSSAAVDLLKARLGDTESPVVLFVGVNQMIALAASNLTASDGGRFIFANRTVSKAAALAERYQAEAFGLDELARLLSRADIVISCTGAPQAVISHQMIDDAAVSRPDRKMFILDLAVPRDVEYDNGTNPLVEVHDLEAIKQFVKEQQARRERAIPQVEEIIERKLAEFVYWFEHVRYEPLYNGLEKSFESIRRHEISELLEKLPPGLQVEVDRATRQLVDHLLHVKVRTTKNSD